MIPTQPLPTQPVLVPEGLTPYGFSHAGKTAPPEAFDRDSVQRAKKIIRMFLRPAPNFQPEITGAKLCRVLSGFLHRCFGESKYNDLEVGEVILALSQVEGFQVQAGEDNEGLFNIMVGSVQNLSVVFLPGITHQEREQYLQTGHFLSQPETPVLR